MKHLRTVGAKSKLKATEVLHRQANNVTCSSLIAHCIVLQHVNKPNISATQQRSICLVVKKRSVLPGPATLVS